MRVLLLSEANRNLCAVVERLRAADAEIDTGDLGEDGLHLAAEYSFDLIVIEAGVHLPASLQMLGTLRRRRLEAPVVMVGNPGASDAVVQALNAGADDFIDRAISAAEFTARIRSLVRRARGIAHPVIEIGELTLDLAGGGVRIAGHPIRLTRTEYAILEAVAVRKGAIVSFDTIQDRLYGGLGETNCRTLQSHLCHLRRKLSVVPGGGRYVRSVVGRGLCLSNPLHDQPPVAA